MAKTQLSDIVVPQTFAPYVARRTIELSRLVASGLVVNNDDFDSYAMGPGKTVDLPYWNIDGGESEVQSDSVALTPEKVDASSDTAVKHFRGKAWAINKLPVFVAGSDPMTQLGDFVAEYWMREMQRTILIPSLTGLFAANGPLNATHLLDRSIADGNNAAAANLISTDNILDAVGLLGDQWSQITAMAVHSAVYRTMQKLNLIEFTPLAGQDIIIPRFLGREVIEDDGLPRVAGGTSGYVYTSYFFGPGAVSYGDGGPEAEEAVKTDEDILANDQDLAVRKNFILHPRGVAFSGSPAGVSPTKTELETGTNWTQKWEDKAIRIVALQTNG